MSVLPIKCSLHNSRRHRNAGISCRNTRSATAKRPPLRRASVRQGSRSPSIRTRRPSRCCPPAWRSRRPDSETSTMRMPKRVRRESSTAPSAPRNSLSSQWRTGDSGDQSRGAVTDIPPFAAPSATSAAEAATSFPSASRMRHETDSPPCGLRTSSVTAIFAMPSPSATVRTKVPHVASPVRRPTTSHTGRISPAPGYQRALCGAFSSRTATRCLAPGAAPTTTSEMPTVKGT